MIPLPPGCTVNYAITIDIDQLTDEMLEWYELIGGEVIQKEHWNSRGTRVEVAFVKYGKSKYCHHRQDGTKGVRLHFTGQDATTASVFLIKFNQHVEQHNMKELMENV